MKRLLLPGLLILTLTLLLTGCPAGESSGVRPVIGSFTADPAIIEAGAEATLSWQVSGATSLKLEPGDLDVTGQTSRSVSPAVTTSYILTAGNKAGSSEATVTVMVRGAGEGTTTAVRAAEGGVIELAGARLVIPPGALNQDTVVSLSVSDAPAGLAGNPMQPAGPQVGVDLGGALLTAAATLTVPYDHAEGMHFLMTEDSGMVDAESMPGTRIRAADLTGDGASVEVTQAGVYGVTAIPDASSAGSFHAAAEGRSGISLQVPFYWQADYPWCSPTATAMYLNYFQPLPGFAGTALAPGGRVSNYGLAGLVRQRSTKGAWPESFLKAAGVSDDLYSWLRWDADLIPSDPFTSYVVLATTGVFGLAPMRPVLTTSDQINHAFVITGLSDGGIYINDGNARWSGAHPSMTWEQFRNQNMIGTRNDELGTLLVLADPRPETERRGSIELSPRTAVDPTRTIRFENPSGALIADWAWEGDPYASGYYFMDQTNPSRWPIDAEFGRVLPRSSQLKASFNIVNITEQPHSYVVTANVIESGTELLLLQREVTVDVGAYRRGLVDLDFGNLADAGWRVSGPVTTGRLEIELRQNGVMQDFKYVSFRLGSDPRDGLSVSIKKPGYIVDGQPVNSITALRNAPVTITASAYDRYALPAGEVPASRLVWTEGGSSLGTGPRLVRSFSGLGRHQLTLTATSEYGVRANDTVTVNVVDPARNPGEVVILYPVNGSGFAPGAGGEEISLIGYATYADGTAVPENRLYWTDSSGTEIGTGSSATVTIYGHCRGREYTFNLTARQVDGTPVGTRSVRILTSAPPC